jgi:hypothetical protein
MLIFFYVMLWMTSIVYQTFQLDDTKYEDDGDGESGEMKVEEGLASIDAGVIELTTTTAQVVNNAASISSTAALYPGSNNLKIEPELHEVKLEDYVDVEV